MSEGAGTNYVTMLRNQLDEVTKATPFKGKDTLIAFLQRLITEATTSDPTANAQFAKMLTALNEEAGEKRYGGARRPRRRATRRSRGDSGKTRRRNRNDSH